MSITLNNSDFQCLQDQLVELKTKNYELTEKTRRSQADFETAKAKICILQLKLEEQERDFQTVSSTLRREIESVTSCNNADIEKENKANENYKLKYKKLVQKAKELQQAYEKTVAVVQQMNARNEELCERFDKLEEENINLKDELESERKTNESLNMQREASKLPSTSESSEVQSSTAGDGEGVEEMRAEIERLSILLAHSNSLNESQAQELKILERKGAQTMKELKRQLALEKNRTEVLQGRLENLLKEPQTNITPTNLDLDIHSKLSTSSGTNDGKDSNTSPDNGSRCNNQDSNSVGSWSFVPVAKDESSFTSSANTQLQAQIDSVSGCSTEPENKTTTENVLPVNSDNKFEDSSVSQSPISPLQQSNSKQNLTSPMSTNATSYPYSQDNSSLSLSNGSSNKSSPINYFKNNHSLNNAEGMLIEEQAALVDRLTKMQHDKWMLEEKLSYLEQANSSLSEDLANKSDIIKHYFIDQALKAGSYYSMESKTGSIANSNNSSRRPSWTPSLNTANSDKSSLKKVVDFLKERSQISLLESENISREATKKMQLMLEETLTKCLKLQENLDYVTSQLNKLNS